MGRPATTARRFRLVGVVAALMAIAGGVAWVLSRETGGQGPVPEGSSGPAPGPLAVGEERSGGPRSAASGPEAPGVDPGTGGATGANRSGALPPGLRAPSGEDMSDPRVLAGHLREALGGAAPRWDVVADLLGRHEGALPPDVRLALLRAFDGGRSPAAVGAFARLRDPSLVPDLLRLLEDASTTPEGRRTVLAALVSMQSLSEPVAAGLARGLRGTLEDRPILEALAQVGGPSAVRALVDAAVRSTDPDALPSETWRALSLRGGAESSKILAEALARVDLSAAARRAVVRLAGRPGASAEVVAALVALDVPELDRESRRVLYASLAATGDGEGTARLLAVASDAAAPGAPDALEALGATTTASRAARDRLLAAARSAPDDAVRAQVVRALGAVREPAAAPLLIELLAHPSLDVRRESVVALGGLGPRGEGAVEALARTYVAGDPALRSRVATALAAIGGDAAKRLLDQLRVGERDEAVRRVVEEAFRKVSGRADDE